MDQERRWAPRFPFIASAEVLSESAGTRLVARISDISASGCYVDTIYPLTDGTPIRAASDGPCSTPDADDRVHDEPDRAERAVGSNRHTEVERRQVAAQLGALQVRAQHARAFVRERPGDAAADAARGTGDQRGVALE